MQPQYPAVIPTAEKLKQLASPNRKWIVIDVASVKQEIITAFEALSSNQMEFISTHPMAGTRKEALQIVRPLFSPHGCGLLSTIKKIPPERDR